LFDGYVVASVCEQASSEALVRHLIGTS
jgi:hypothetical protein